MEYVEKDIEAFGGLRLDVNSANVPLGSFTVLQNIHPIAPDRLQKIYGAVPKRAPVVDTIAPTGDAPQCFAPLFSITLSGVPKLCTPLQTTSSVIRLFDHTDNSEITGGSTFVASAPILFASYNNKNFIVNDNSIFPQEITSSTAKGDTGFPKSKYLLALKDRLYFANIESGGASQFRRTTPATETLDTSTYNTFETPGVLTGLAYNAYSTDVQGLLSELLLLKDRAIMRFRPGESSADDQKDILSAKWSVLRGTSAVVNSSVGTIIVAASGTQRKLFLVRPNTQLLETPMSFPLGVALDDTATSTLPKAEIILAMLGNFLVALRYEGVDGPGPTQLYFTDLDQFREDQLPVWSGPHSFGDDPIVGTELPNASFVTVT